MADDHDDTDMTADGWQERFAAADIHAIIVSPEAYDELVRRMDEPPDPAVVARLREFMESTPLPWGEPRPVERIRKVLAALEIAWSRVPDERLGQLIYNIVLRHPSIGRADEGNRLFNLEDDEMLRLIQEYAKGHA